MRNACCKGLLCILFFIFSNSAYSQVKKNQLNKLSCRAQQKLRIGKAGQELIFCIAVKNFETANVFFQKYKSVEILSEYKSVNLFLVRTTWNVIDSILPSDEIIFVDIFRKPKEETALGSLDISVNKVNLVHSLFPEYNGKGIGVSLKENLPDTGDIDIKGRYLPSRMSSSIFSEHATNMASIIAGAGNTYFKGRGIAWAATLSSANFEILLPESNDYYEQYGVSVQNHSYGTGIENYYGVEAAAYDASVIAMPNLLHVFSAGNSGNDADDIGPYKGLSGYSNITGSFKMAKNIITVGNVDSIYQVLPRSSRGPAYDGRVKPELVAYAEDGSSGAAAIVSGISIILQQAYKNTKGKMPSAALIKAILINSADDVGARGIDYASGYGNVNAAKAMTTLVDNRYVVDSVFKGNTRLHKVSVPSGLAKLKISLIWTDPPALSNAAKALINDLDLSVTDANQVWLPWVLNSYPNADSLIKGAIRKRDSLNNVEQITIDNPLPGDYIINIHGFDISGTSSQTYAIAYEFDSLNMFQWYYPAAKNTLSKNAANIVRWNSTYVDSIGKLEYSVNNGNTWQVIDQSISLKKGYYEWKTPDIFAEAIVRLNFSGNLFVSDTFTISSPLVVEVGFNCKDSFLLFWKRPAGIDSFRVFELAENFMKPLMDVRDSFVIVKKSKMSALYYTVAPLLNKLECVRSYSLDFSAKGFDCYVKTISASLSGSYGVINIELGTLYNIKSIQLQKLIIGEFKNIGSEIYLQNGNYSYVDSFLIRGANQYRVVIMYSDGDKFYSKIVSVFNNGSDAYVIFPNPVLKNQPVIIFSNYTEVGSLCIFNAVGVKMLEQKMYTQYNIVQMGHWISGVYFFQVRKRNGDIDKTYKVVLN